MLSANVLLMCKTGTVSANVCVMPAAKDRLIDDGRQCHVHADPLRERRDEPQTYSQPRNETIREGVRNDAA